MLPLSVAIVLSEPCAACQMPDHALQRQQDSLEELPLRAAMSRDAAGGSRLLATQKKRWEKAALREKEEGRTRDLDFYSLRSLGAKRFLEEPTADVAA